MDFKWYLKFYHILRNSILKTGSIYKNDRHVLNHIYILYTSLIDRRLVTWQLTFMINAWHVIQRTDLLTVAWTFLVTGIPLLNTFTCTCRFEINRKLITHDFKNLRWFIEYWICLTFYDNTSSWLIKGYVFYNSFRKWIQIKNHRNSKWPL